MGNNDFKRGNEYGQGRPPGARNKSSYALREALKARGDRDPAEFLSEVASDENEAKELRLAAANYLMPHYHSKLGAIPVPPPDQYFEEAISLPKPTTVRQACENIALLSDMKSTGKLAIAKADTLIADQRFIASALVDEQKLLTAEGGPSEQVIRIEGGLPALPGTDVIMPDYNGNGAASMNGHGPCDPTPTAPGLAPQPSSDEVSAWVRPSAGIDAGREPHRSGA